MATKYAIETVYKIIDKVSAPLAGIGKSSRAVASGLKRDFSGVCKSMTTAGKAFDKVVKRSFVAGGVAVAGGLAVATKQFIEFDSAMTKAGALFKDMDTAAASFKANIKELSSVARDVAAKTEFTAVDTADALQKMAMAGIDSNNAMSLLAKTADLATAAGVGLGEAVGIAVDSMGAMGMNVGAKNLQRVSDVMAKAASMANTDLVGVFSAIKNAGPIFVSAGQSVETLAAAIDMLADGGIKAEEAGTELKAIFMQLSQTAKQDQLAKLGVSVTDAQGNFLSLVDIVEQLDKRLAKMGSAERSGVITGVFGARGAVAINNILNGGVEKLKEYEKALRASEGAAASMANTMRGSLANRIEVLKSALTELGLKFVEGFAEKGNDGLQRLADKILALSTNCGSLVDAFNRFINIGVSALGLLWKWKGVLLDLILVWGIFKTAVLATNFVTALMPFLHLLKALVVGTNAWTAASAVLSAVWKANPVGLVITGIAVLVGLVILAVRHFDKLKGALLKVWGVVMGFGAAIVDFLLAPIQGVLGLLSKIPGLGALGGVAGNIGNFRDDISGRAVAEPVTQGDRVAYSREESVSKVDISVAPEKGSMAKIQGGAPGVDIKMASSASF